MDRAERGALVLAGIVMVVFFAALVYSATGLNLAVPTCVTDVAPFREGKVIDKGNNHYEVHMVAKMWAFDPPEVRLPPGADVDFYLSALDVTHGMYIEHTNVNLMAVPGAVNAASVHFDHEGSYDVICHEYCGTGHQNMMGKIVIAKGAIVPPPPPPGPAGALGIAALGKQLFETKGCAGCHSIDGAAGVGPTMKGLYGHETEMEDGAMIRQDDAHIAEEIREPTKHVVKGFPPVMPPAALTDDELDALVAYLKTLS
jgi:cytochrome c oxidase subunit 2